MTHPPFSCNKAVLFNLKKDIEESDEIKDLFKCFITNGYENYDINTIDGEGIHDDVLDYINQTISANKTSSFCSNSAISGMNTNYLLNNMTANKMVNANAPK